MASNVIILYESEYAHVIDNQSGEISLIEGPQRIQLPAHQTLLNNKQQKIVLRDNQYLILSNPYDQSKGACRMGESVVVKGPKVLPLYPGESVSAAYNALLLNRTQYIFVQATNDFDDRRKLNAADEALVKRKAGDIYRFVGPLLFIPERSERIVADDDGNLVRNAISIGERDAIYVRNKYDGELHLVHGPMSFILATDQELYYKPLSADEYYALKLKATPRFWAYNIEVYKNEALCIIDYKANNAERYIIGPQSVLLGPYEGIKVISLSGGRPKKENMYKIATVQLGVDFCVDNFPVRTRDNAVLELEVSYTWKFLLSDDNWKIFSGDFIGYACQSLRSRIRDAASQYDFEQFHTNSSTLLRDKLLKDVDVTLKRDGKDAKEYFRGRLFSEFNFAVLSIDVKSVKPVDEEIRDLLDQSIRASMRILTSKMEEEATIYLEREKILAEAEVSKLKKNLIELESNNLAQQLIEEAKTRGRAQVEKASAEAEAEAMLLKTKLDHELSTMTRQLEMLSSQYGERYLEYKKTQKTAENVSSATVLPANVQLKLMRNQY